MQLYLKLFYLYCDIAVGQEDPAITMVIWPEIKRVGMTGYLNCTVNRQTNNKVNFTLTLLQQLVISEDGS